MTKPLNPVVRLGELELEPFERGKTYGSSDASFGARLGLTQIGAGYSEVPPGKSSCPFHVHHMEDEMFVILSGEGDYRFGDETYAVKAGDVLGAPRGGPEYAHKLVNTGTEPLKYLSISSKSTVEVCEYPDSGKFMVRSAIDKETRGSSLRFVARWGEGRDYWEDEDGA